MSRLKWMINVDGDVEGFFYNLSECLSRGCIISIITQNAAVNLESGHFNFKNC